MSLETAEMCRLLCDGCGKGLEDEDDVCLWWSSDMDALDAAREAEWVIRDDGHWCEDCTAWADEAVERGEP